MTRQQALNIFINTDVKEECNLFQSKILQKTEHFLDAIVKEIEEQIALFYKQIVIQQKKIKNQQLITYNFLFYYILSNNIKCKY